MAIKDLKIFKLSRIGYEELWNDAVAWIQQTYSEAKQKFNTSSPFSQLLQVMLHMGRMVLYYIEDSITGLNIKTAYRPDQIRGLATLSGHDPSRAVGARGGIRISYYNSGTEEHHGEVCFIPNKSVLKNTLNGLSYIVLFGADNAKMSMTASNYIDATVIQGLLKYQQATSTGTALQSYNFTERNYAEIDQYFVNVYVNGERWTVVDAFLDMTYNQKACLVRTGMLGGIDVFFGNTDNGAIPPSGATILVEYLITNGVTANIDKDTMNEDNYWTWQDMGYLKDGTSVDLNKSFRVKCTTDIIFGTRSEDTALTQLIAPHASRSMVLANETNYRYFLQKMNMFSVIEIIKGYTTEDDNKAQISYNEAYNNYTTLNAQYINLVGIYGSSSQQAQDMLKQVEDALAAYEDAKAKLEDSGLDDNTVYLMLIPDIVGRMSSATNYFTCPQSLFFLSEDEKENIINLIDSTGQRVLTVENRIIDPRIAKFAINAVIRLWNGYDQTDIYNSCVNKLSDYLLHMNRRDLIPASDIVALFEDIEGVDSVQIFFDADVENEAVYGKKGFRGINEYGDIVLTRNVTDVNGSVLEVRDIFPLFRGPFSSKDGVQYSDNQELGSISCFNMTVSGYSQPRTLNLHNSQQLA